MKIIAISSVKALPMGAWRALEAPDFPFFDFEFLAALETSGSIGAEAGWTPRYLLAQDDGRTLGALCLYEKAHGYGEFIFDWDWARAYAQAGINYYPKLVAAVPFTPATGPKLLLAADADRAIVGGALLAEAMRMVGAMRASSLHALYLTPADAEDFKAAGYMIRHNLQLGWVNKGYGTFEDFLAALTGKRRREIQRERTRLEGLGVTVERLTGPALTLEHAALIDRYYRATVDKKESHAYLAPGFFDLLFKTMGDRIVLMLARRADGTPCGAALFFVKGQDLYGRYAGADADVPFLHFELCYHQGIAYAIERRLARFDAGAQGGHKLPRGFLPTIVLSAHHIARPDFRAPIDAYVAMEQKMVEEERRSLLEHSPYKS